jgi:hypothetical protein
MKRFFVAAAASLMAATTFIACSDDKEESAPESLVGTKWVAPALKDFDGYMYSLFFAFDTAAVAITGYYGPPLGVWGASDRHLGFGAFTYVYSKPTVTVGKAIYTGIVSGSKLVVTKGDDGQVIELTLQE